jgi:hypothetical protein
MKFLRCGGDRDSGVIESRSVWAYVGLVRLHLSCRSRKCHLSIRRIRIVVVGNESVGEGTVLRCFRSPTGIGFLVAVIRVLGRCRAMESEVLLIEVEEQVRVSRDLVGSIEVLSI